MLIKLEKMRRKNKYVNNFLSDKKIDLIMKLKNKEQYNLC